MNKIVGYLQLAWLMKSPPALFSRLFGLPWYRNMLEQWVMPILTPKATVLEVGCAAGDFSRALSELHMNVWAVDISSQMMAKALQTPSQVQFSQADAARLPFPDQSFDVVLAASLINVVDSLWAIVDEMRRVCREGGIVSLLAPVQSFSDADAKRHIEEEQLAGLSSAAFSAWHRLGRKMDAVALLGYFEDQGMTDITINKLLGGMVVAISGRPGNQNRYG